MKTCNYCGRENDASEFKSDASSAANAVVENQKSEAQLRDILSDPSCLFKTLVVISTVCYLIWFFQFYLFGRFISVETYNALSWNGYGALLRTPERVMWLFMLLFVALAIGLWNFSKSARLVFTSLLTFLTLWSLLAGVQTETAFSSFFSYIGDLADGAILVMAYTSPLKNKFA